MGHTQSSGDSMHACIENYTKHKSIYTQNQWIHHIRECKQDGKPYEVTEVLQDNIYAFDTLSNLFNWKNTKTSSIREICVKPNSDEIYVKYNFLDKTPKSINIFKKNKKINDVISHALPKAYNNLIPLKDKKKTDLNVMITKNLIPAECLEDFTKVLII